MRIVLTTAAAVVAAAALAMAHEVNYKGTVVKVATNRYAASDGVLACMEVKLPDRQRTMVFDITAQTGALAWRQPCVFRRCAHSGTG